MARNESPAERARRIELEHDAYRKETGFWGREGAGCLFLARDTARLLIAHRSVEVEQPLTWGTWGGAMDPGETPQQTVRREGREEANYKGAMKLIPLAVFAHESGFRYHNFLAVVDHQFEIELDRNKNWETQDYAWCRFGEFPDPLHPGVEYLLEHSGADIERIIEQECAAALTRRQAMRPR